MKPKEPRFSEIANAAFYAAAASQAVLDIERSLSIARAVKVQSEAILNALRAECAAADLFDELKAKIDETKP